MHLTFFLLLFSFAATAQIKKQAAWQQRVDYVINVKLDDVQHTLSANEVITYTNNSPDELKEIYFHLWANAYRNNETAFAKQLIENGKTDFYYAEEDARGWIDSLDFRINNERVEWQLTSDIDIARIIPIKPIKSGETITITTPFKVKIPTVFSRMGHEEQLYCITQWYPKPAVYDVNGWNPMPYLDQGEFYSEFGKFDVSITVPENYIVAATGNLQNEDELQKLFELSKEKFDFLNSSDAPTSLTNKNFNSSFPPSSTTLKTLHYVQDSIHDFAWFADKRFKVERSEVTLASGKKVTTWFFSPNPEESVVHWMDTAVLFYSRLVGEYPYAHATGVYTPLLAGGGMEYPTITNMSSVDRQVIVHEVGHNWFYGILGSNERAYPWMDESINNYYETRSIYKKELPRYGGMLETIKTNTFDIEGLTQLQLLYSLNARRNDDQKVFLPSTEFTDFNYGGIVYGKAALAFMHLQSYLGDVKFDAMMKSYYEKWKFKHPLPNDFIEHANSFTGENLSWFFDGLMNSETKLDFKIKSINKKKGTVTVKSNIPNAPFSITTIKGKQNSYLFRLWLYRTKLAPPVYQTTWYKGSDSKIATYPINIGDADLIRLDAYELTTDVYRNNNIIRTKGLLKKWQKSKFEFLGNLENPYVNQIFFIPVIGANLYNKTMLGMAFYNSILPKKKTEYLFVPMYAFGSKDLVGYGEINRQIAASGSWYKDISIGLKVARFAYIDWYKTGAYFFNIPFYGYGLISYEKVEPSLNIRFRKNNERTDADKSLLVRHSMINEQGHTQKLFSNFGNHFNYTTATFNYDKKRKLNPYQAQLNIQNGFNGKQFSKIWGEASVFLNYNKEKKGFYARAFAGSFLQKLTVANFDSRPFFRTGNTGRNDYLYDQSQFGRSEGGWIPTSNIFSHQLLFGELQFKELYSGVSTNSWASSANLETTIPGIIPIRVYADFALVNNYTALYTINGKQDIYENKFLYTGGFALVLFKDIFRVNFPLMATKEMTERPATNGGTEKVPYGQRISFSLNLNKLNPLKMVRNISF